VSLFYLAVLALCVFIGVDAAWTGHWIVFALVMCVTLYFLFCPEDIEKATDDGQD
jgi:hypothetical protein